MPKNYKVPFWVFGNLILSRNNLTLRCDISLNAMDAPGTGEAMKSTAERLMGDKQRILELWENRVRQLVPASEDSRKTVLMDHIPLFLDNLSINLSEKKEDSQQNKSDTTQANREHGEQRANIPEYSLQEVFKEYELLRLTMSEVLQESGPVPPKDFDKINQYLDQAIARAGCEFVAIRQTEVEDLTVILKRSNEDLERFAAIVAHDVRSPLSTIFSFAGLLDENLGSEKSPMIQKSLDVITSNAHRLMVLVERLLEYSTIGSTKKRFEAVPLNQIVASTITNLKTLIDETHTTVLSEGLPTVKGDPSLFVQLFQNLIANSIKFRKPSTGVKIKISLIEETLSDWLFCIKDNGMGFDSAMKEKIFEPFKKLHSKEEYAGSGLGLATCRRVVELHGGKIWAESEPGIGSKFYFTLSKNPKGEVR